jgi:rhodanese-related sulfurtransferase
VAERLHPSQEAAPPDDLGGLGPDDVQLEAFHVLQRAGIGWEFAFVDIRERAEIADLGSVPDASSLPLSELEARWREVPTDRTTVLLCPTGDRSATAALRLRALGRDDVWAVRGGLRAWAREGGPLERG